MAAFQCWLRLPLISLEVPITRPVTLVQIVIPPYKEVSRNDLLFIVSAPGGTYEVRSNMAGGFSALRPKAGQEIAEGEQFGCIVAEGEDIPCRSLHKEDPAVVRALIREVLDPGANGIIPISNRPRGVPQ